MTFVADESWSKTDPAALTAAGYTGVIGYCSYDRTGKNLDKAHIDSYHAAGLHVGLVWETHNQAASEGASTGTKEANDFLAQLQTLGATGGTVWMVGEDPNALAPSQAIRDYFAAAAAILTPAGFRLGDYGSERTVNDTVGAVPGVTRKWFVGGWSQTVNADLIQQSSHPGASTLNGSVDCNYAPADDWGWTEFGTATPAPPAPAPVAVAQPQRIAEDGVFGAQTIRALQAAIGAPQDGVYGPDTRRHMQAHLGAAQDGIVGPQTIRALQARIGCPQDGIWGPQTTRALQSALNRHAF